MHDLTNVGPRIILGFGDGSVFVTESVLFGIMVATVIAVVLVWLGKGLTKSPSKKQVMAELIVEFVYNTTQKTMGPQNLRFAPFIGTIFLFVMLGSALGLFGFRPITADINTAFALSTITFMVINVSSIRALGLKGKLQHMCDPYPFMFPIKFIEMFSLPVSLGFRLFGNIFGGAVVMTLMFTGLASACYAIAKSIPIFGTIPFLKAGIPLPAMMFFDIFHPIVQAYIFTMLTMVFLSIEIMKHGDDH